MKKLGLVVKQEAESTIKSSLDDSISVLLIQYAGLKSADLTQLRKSLRQAHASLRVVRNSVAQRALKDCGKESLVDAIDGPCGMVFAKDEPVNASKIIYSFIKEHEQLKVAGGFLQDKILTTEDVEALSKLPTIDQLRAKLVMTINAPRVGLVMALNNTLRKFVICLDKIREKKQSST